MHTEAAVTREKVVQRDREDPLAALREHFDLPPDLRYFDGNSLGPLQPASRERVHDTVARQWGQDLIQSWNQHAWIDLPRKVGGKIARLIGAEPSEVVVADSTSVNLFKLLAAALALNPGRTVILSEASQFPTDLYMAQGLATMAAAKPSLRLVERRELLSAIDRDVAVLSLSHVDFKTGELADLSAITAAAHERGALVLWDLSHSAGAMEIELDGAGVDLAVGCTYKFLNGGPGAPAYVYVARRHHEQARSPLWGWFGHRTPFAFDTDYQPAAGIDRFQCGTPPVLSLAALDSALDVFEGMDLGALRLKSTALGDLFLELVEQRCQDQGLEIACPTDSRRRGSQVALRHPAGYPIMQALIERRVVGDFRTPDILRFGLCPLYQRYLDVWDAVETLRQILAERSWDKERFHHRSAVT
ncbi:MAG: kynureninase [Acidobacteriota bacterium]